MKKKKKKKKKRRRRRRRRGRATLLPRRGGKKGARPRKSKKRKKEKKGNVRGEEQKNNKGNPCAHAYGYFCQSRKNSFLLSFLSILERRHIGGHGEKASKPHNLFFFLLTQPNTL